MTKPTSFEQHLHQDLVALEETTAAPEIFRLAQARRRAMAQEKHSQPKILWPTFGVSLASLALVGVMLNGQMGLDNQQEASIKGNLGDEVANDEMLLDTSDEYLDLYEDLDFYYWLADTDMGSTS